MKTKLEEGIKIKKKKELIVLPYKIELFFVATTVTPVANVDSVFLKFTLFIFINFFVNKWNQSIYFF